MLMRLPRVLLLLSFALLAAIPARAQVDKLAIRTTGISCGTCALMSEIYLRRMTGIEAIKISLSTEAILVSYKPDALFQPHELRDALKKTDVGVLQFQVTARGLMHEQDGRRFFIAGRERFVLIPSDATPLPANTPVIVEAILNDQSDPMELKVMTVKPYTP
jgi:hypothetical protein